MSAFLACDKCKQPLGFYDIMCKRLTSRKTASGEIGWVKVRPDEKLGEFLEESGFPSLSKALEQAKRKENWQLKQIVAGLRKLLQEGEDLVRLG